MSYGSDRHNVPRRRHSGNGIRFSDEFLFGFTRGAYTPPGGEAHRRPRETYEAGATFEETYPKYPFSELVRLSIKLGGWLGRVLRQRPEASPLGKVSRYLADPFMPGQQERP